MSREAGKVHTLGNADTTRVGIAESQVNLAKGRDSVAKARTTRGPLTAITAGAIQVRCSRRCGGSYGPHDFRSSRKQKSSALEFNVKYTSANHCVLDRWKKQSEGAVKGATAPAGPLTNGAAHRPAQDCVGLRRAGLRQRESKTTPPNLHEGLGAPIKASADRVAGAENEGHWRARRNSWPTSSICRVQHTDDETQQELRTCRLRRSQVSRVMRAVEGRLANAADGLMVNHAARDLRATSAPGEPVAPLLGLAEHVASASKRAPRWLLKREADRALRGNYDCCLPANVRERCTYAELLPARPRSSGERRLHSTAVKAAVGGLRCFELGAAPLDEAFSWTGLSPKRRLQPREYLFWSGPTQWSLRAATSAQMRATEQPPVVRREAGNSAHQEIAEQRLCRQKRPGDHLWRQRAVRGRELDCRVRVGRARAGQQPQRETAASGAFRASSEPASHPLPLRSSGAARLSFRRADSRLCSGAQVPTTPEPRENTRRDTHPARWRCPWTLPSMRAGFIAHSARMQMQVAESDEASARMLDPHHSPRTKNIFCAVYQAANARARVQGSHTTDAAQLSDRQTRAQGPVSSGVIGPF